MSNHTPGPWSVFIGESGDDYQMIAMFGLDHDGNTYVIGQDHTQMHDGTAKHDATLASAAPEMLEVLEKIIYGDPDDSYCIPGRLVLDAEYAISKARGKSDTNKN